MGFFSRQPKSELPENLGGLLAEHGRLTFGIYDGPYPEQSPELSAFLSTLMPLQPQPGWDAPIVEGIRQVGLRQGGWAVYGARDLVVGYGSLTPVSEEAQNELSDACVRFLMSLQLPNFRGSLNGYDMGALQRVDPELYGRLFSS